MKCKFLYNLLLAIMCFLYIDIKYLITYKFIAYLKNKIGTLSSWDNISF